MSPPTSADNARIDATIHARDFLTTLGVLLGIVAVYSLLDFPCLLTFRECSQPSLPSVLGSPRFVMLVLVIVGAGVVVTRNQQLRSWRPRWFGALILRIILLAILFLSLSFFVHSMLEEYSYATAIGLNPLGLGLLFLFSLPMVLAPRCRSCGHIVWRPQGMRWPLAGLSWICYRCGEENRSWSWLRFGSPLPRSKTWTVSRPLGVYVLTGVAIMIGALLLAFTALATVPTPFDLLAVVGTFFGGVPFFLAYGLWHGERWAWNTLFAFTVVRIIISALAAFGVAFATASVQAWLGIVVSWSLVDVVFVLVSLILVDAVVVYYLTRHHVKAFFGKTPRRRS